MNGCDKCMWRDQCHGTERCEYYDPILGSGEEETKNQEAARREFREEWFEYIKEHNDSYDF